MEPSILCRELEDLVEQQGITVRHESFDDPLVIHRSGLCIIKGRRVLFVEKGATLQSKINIYGECLSQLDLRHVFLKPAVRNYLEKFQGTSYAKSKQREEGDVSAKS